jgi:hypothetical protein
MTPYSSVAAKFCEQLLNDCLKRKFSLEYEVCAYTEELFVFHTISKMWLNRVCIIF